MRTRIEYDAARFLLLIDRETGRLLNPRTAATTHKKTMTAHLRPRPKKTYQGRRTPAGVLLVTVKAGRRAWRPLNPRLDIYNHSPDGFECGYGGSGPAQLALAILADHLGGDRKEALKLHQPFKWACTSKLPKDKDWTLTTEQIDLFIAQL